MDFNECSLKKKIANRLLCGRFPGGRIRALDLSRVLWLWDLEKPEAMIG